MPMFEAPALLATVRRRHAGDLVGIEAAQPMINDQMIYSFITFRSSTIAV